MTPDRQNTHNLQRGGGQLARRSEDEPNRSVRADNRMSRPRFVGVQGQQPLPLGRSEQQQASGFREV